MGYLKLTVLNTFNLKKCEITIIEFYQLQKTDRITYEKYENKSVKSLVLFLKYELP